MRTTDRNFLVALATFAALFAAYQAASGATALGAPAGVGPAIMVATLGFAWLVARLRGLTFAAAYALEWRGRAAGWFAATLAAAIAGKLLALWLGLRVGVYATDPWVALPTAATLAGLLPWIAISTFVPSLVEDILTRGFWARAVPWHWSGGSFVLFTAVLYAANHIWRLYHGWPEWLMLFCFGVAYAAAAWRSGTLWAAVGLHWGWNLAGQMVDAVDTIHVLAPNEARALSAAAHLLLAALLLLAPAKGRLLQRGDTPVS